MATINADELPAVAASSPTAVRVRVTSRAEIELYQYAPAAQDPTRPSIVIGAFWKGLNASDAMADLPLPRLTGANSPIDLSNALPLKHAFQYHAGDPIFIRVTDLDQNNDWTARDTIRVRVTDDLTGDSELVRLTENGTDSGTFFGYLPSTPPPTLTTAATVTPASRMYDGKLELLAGSVITGRYVDVLDDTDVVSTSAVVDPATIVFDSSTGKPVDGVEVTLIDVATGTAATVRGDDGSSTFPATLKSGDKANDSSGRLYEFAPGTIRFPWVQPGQYRYVLKTPSGYLAPSRATDASLKALPGGPFAISTPGSRGESFLLELGPGFRIDIPVDPSGTVLWVQKTAGKDRVGVGDFLSYDITVTNIGQTSSATGAKAVDTLPVGFRYQPGSAQLDGTPLADPSVSPDGRTLTFDVGTIPPGTSVVVRFVVQIGPATKVGETATNLATATADGQTSANIARALVKVGDDFLTSRSILMGRVTTGECGPVAKPLTPAPVAEKLPAVVTAPPPEPPRPGQLGLQLRQQVGETSAAYSVDVWGQSAPMNDRQIVIDLPRGLNYEPGSAALDGATFPDPEIEGATLRFRLVDEPAGNWKNLLTFRAYLAAGARMKDQVVSASANGLGPAGDRVTTDKSTAPVTLVPRMNNRPVNITLRPHFATLGTELSPQDQRELDRVAQALKKAHVNRIAVIGHTDSDQIKGKALKRFKDNHDLSLARAISVGEYLTKRLGIPEDQIAFDGKGEDEPIADNGTSEGRAMNRRVEVAANAAEQTSEFLLSEGATPAVPTSVTAVVPPAPVAEAPALTPTQPAASSDSTAASVVTTASTGTSVDSSGAATAQQTSSTEGAQVTAAEEGVAGVRIVMEDGTYVMTDKNGLFHFEGVAPGLHVVQLDLDSLPDGYEALSCKTNDRFAGRTFSQFVEVGGGVLWRADFLVHHIPVAPLPPPPVEAPVAPVIPQAPAAKTEPGELALSLTQHIDGLNVAYRAQVSGALTDFATTLVTVELPADVNYVPGSATLDGAPAEVKLDGSSLVFDLGRRSGDWSQAIAFNATVPEGARQGTRITVARASGTGARDSIATTPPAPTVLRVGQEGASKPKKLVIRPHFPTFSVTLSPEDKKELDGIADYLRGMNLEKIVVTGYTDSDPINGARAKKLFKDNVALSLGRASSVGRYLMEALQLAPSKIEFVGKGEADPVDTNATREGKARNRRVEVLAEAVQTTMHTTVASLSDESGLQKVLAAVAVLVVAPESPAPSKGNGAGAAGATTASTASDPVAAAGSVVMVAPAGKPAAPATPSKLKRPEDGLLSPMEGELLADRINAVQVRLKSWLKPHLSVDGVEIAEERIGLKSEDAAQGKTTYTYVGVDLGQQGPHLISVWGTDPFGNDRMKQTVRVVRTGEIAAIRLVSSDGNAADGHTPVRIRVELLDQTGDVIHGSAKLEIREGNLNPPRKDKITVSVEEEATNRIVSVDKDGWVAFAPVPTSGSYRVLLAAGAASLPVEVWVKPEMRDWILVGLAEGTVGYDVVKGNMETASAADVPENLYADGRVAFYGKGQIKGQWLLTVAYDTRQPTQNEANSLFQIIDPQTYFTLYGDASQQQYDASSSRKIYVKIERDQFYALFGDFDSGLTVTELSRYARRMNGIKAEVQTNMVEVNAFGTQTDRVFTQDRIQGDGTSGLYHLSRQNLTVNSDVIRIEVRDRFRSEVIVSTRTLTRFIDYSIDYDTGTIFFAQPIASRDDAFNPMFIVAEYETALTGKPDFTYGGRAGVKLLDQRLKIGATAIHEGQDAQQNNLLGADLKLEIVKGFQLRGEYAWTNSRAFGTVTSGMSWLTELAYTSRLFDAKAYYRNQETGFGLGQQSTTESGTRKMGLEAAYRFSDRLSLSGQVYDQHVYSNGSDRLLGEARLNYAPRIWGGYVGFLSATDRLAGGDVHTSGQITGGLKWLTLSERLIFTIDHAQTVYGNSSVDFPTRTVLGVEYKILPTLSLVGAQEFTWSNKALTTNTRLGLRSNLWKGGSLATSIDRQMNENAWRIFGNIGLKQSWQLTEAWKIDAGGERSQTIKEVGWYQFNPNVPPSSGSTTEDFTAVSTGASYQVKGLVWDNRAEGRFATSETKWGFISGAVGELGNGWAWSARAQYLGSLTKPKERADTASARVGFVYRPAKTNWILLNRLDFILDRKDHSSSNIDSWRVVENFLANWKPHEAVQASAGYGGKFAHERISEKVYQGYTDQLTAEARVDVHPRVDIGLRGSVLHSWNGHKVSGSVGPSVGVSVIDNTWIGVGYNLWGYDDPDLSASNYTAQGPYIRLRVKFDQLTLPGVAAWLNKQ